MGLTEAQVRSSSKAPKKRKFDGRWFKLGKVFRSERDAKKYAATMRKKGYYARVTPDLTVSLGHHYASARAHEFDKRSGLDQSWATAVYLRKRKK